MAKQISMEDILTPAAVQETAKFLQDAYRLDDAHLPIVGTRYEAYGLLASANQAVLAAVANLKSDMADALKTLNMEDANFLSAADSIRATLLELAGTTVSMYEHAMNISAQMFDRVSPAAPLLEMITDELPGDDTETAE